VPSDPIIEESRRSIRVQLEVGIVAVGTSEPLACEGDTIVVNFHGALISTHVPLHVGMQIEVCVILTAKRASAEVVYVHPEQPLQCGIALTKPQNIWGVSLPPEDWSESEVGDFRR
jgi:hypothetical protein